MTETGVHVKYAFLCDDVRSESNGKLIFIGAYAGNIQVAQLPITMAPQLVMFLESEGSARFEVSIQARLDDKVLGSLSGELEAGQQGGAFVPARLPPMRIEEEGLLNIRFKRSGKRWQSLLSLPVVCNWHPASATWT